MPYEFQYPDVGEGLEKGEIVEFCVEEGEEVQEDQTLFKVENDKAVMDISCPADGIIDSIKVDVGDTVKVGDLVLTINREDNTDGDNNTSNSGSDEGVEVQSDTPGSSSKRVFASPSVRRLAREENVNIEHIEGSGKSGRITREDVKNSDAEETTSEENNNVSGEKVLAAPVTRKLASNNDVNLSSVKASKEKDGLPFVTYDDVEDHISKSTESKLQEESNAENTIPYKGVRKTIGNRMEKAYSEVPHVTHQDEIQVPDLPKVRENLNSEYDEVNITYTSIIVKIVASVLKDHKVINSSLNEEDEEIVLHDDVNIGVAVDTEQGLIVPVVKKVNEKRVRDIAKEIETLAEKARNGKHESEDMSGSTFTVTNIGVIGGTYSTPIVNLPNSSILAVGSIEERAVSVDGELQSVTTAPVSLSIDHRIVDGADAARFVNDLGRKLRHPELLL